MKTSSHRGFRLTAAPPRASSCWPPGRPGRGQQQPARHRRGQLPPRHRAHPRHPRRRRGSRRDRRHRIRQRRPGRGRQRRIGHQRRSQRGEHLPDLLRPRARTPAASPAPSRPGGPAAPRSPGARPRPPSPPAPARSPRRRRPAGPGTTPAAAHASPRTPGTATAAGPAPRPVPLRRPGTAPRRAPVPPPGQHPPARRAGQLPAPQLPFDHARSAFTVSTTPPRVNPAALPSPAAKTKKREGRTHLRRDHRAVAHEKGQPEGCPQTPYAPSVTQPCPYIVIPGDRDTQELETAPCGQVTCLFSQSMANMAAVYRRSGPAGSYRPAAGRAR